MNNISSEKLQIGNLFNKLLSEGNQIRKFKDYELIDCTSLNMKTRTLNGWIPVRFLSRHKTPKHLVELVVKTFDGEKSLVVTTDHVCMVYSKEWILEEKAAKDLNVGDYVNVFNDSTNMDDNLGSIISISDLGETEEYVYDMELDDENKHWFYANNILVHNSQFVNIQYITDYFIKKFNLPEKMSEWSDENKLKLWNFVEKFVEEKVNPFVQNLVKEKCFTEHPEVLRYSLEYIADSGVYEQKKRYCVHKIVEEGPILVDKFKYTGIELKRSNVSPQIKEFLREIYENTVMRGWTNEDYENYLKEIYGKFCQLDIETISFWKGWASDKIETTGFLSFGKGTTGISKACKSYNQLIDHLKIGKKYEMLKPGDKVRFCYVYPSNVFGIEAIAFPNGSWPKEFDDYFRVDYKTMFQKTILDPLKSFREATKFSEMNPANSPSFDIFGLE